MTRLSDLKMWFKHDVFDSSREDPNATRLSATVLQKVLLPRFSKDIFNEVSLAYFLNGNQGLSGEFNGATLLADGAGGRFIVTLDDGDGTSVSFKSYMEEPFGRFRRPSISAYYGVMANMESLVNEIAQKIKEAKREGQGVFQNDPVMTRMFGG